MSGKYALIIGNTEYVDPGLAKLTAPSTYNVVVEYHSEWNCGDALFYYGIHKGAPPQVIGQIIVQ